MEIPMWLNRGMLSSLSSSSSSSSSRLTSASDDGGEGTEISLNYCCCMKNSEIMSQLEATTTTRTHSQSSTGFISARRKNNKLNKLNDNEQFNEPNNKHASYINCNYNDNCVKSGSSGGLSSQQWRFSSLFWTQPSRSRRRLNCLDYLWPTLVIILSFLICLSAGNNQCAKGLKTPGRTWPPGDIVLEEGNPLRILCLLNKTYTDEHFPGKNASDLVFFRSGKEVDQQYISIINETTIEMFIEKPAISKEMYYCKMRRESGKDYEAVCLNNVVIGTKPKEPENFTCISRNWENMTCMWDPIPNTLETKFSIAFKLPGRAGGRQLYPCPKSKDDDGKMMTKNYCFWSIYTNPIYRQPYEYYTFILTAENALGNFSTTYKFHHYAHVIPSKPANLTLVNKSLDSVLLYWSVPLLIQNFPPGLHHRITYKNQWETAMPWKVIDIENEVHLPKRYYNLSGLRFANTVYDVRVYLKSAMAIGEDSWGQFSDLTFRTPPREPGDSPKTDIGSFEITENLEYRRDIYLYWQGIAPYLENGDEFTYKIVCVERSGKKLAIRPNNTTRTYAIFKNMTYESHKFELVATNVVGPNPNKSVIYVPSKLEIPNEPVSFTKIAFETEGKYELSWKPPLPSRREITTYTIFWCENERDRPYLCTGYLQWDRVPANTTVFNVTVPNPRKVYQFAISANTAYSSSGMVWASCTVIANRVVGKMKTVWINSIGSSSIEVGWKLECSDRIGVVEGFNIYYCPIISPYNLNCKGPKQSTTIWADTHTIYGSVEGLTPYTTYMITVSVLTKNGEGLHSDPLYNTTLEAAPTRPRHVTITDVTNSTMKVTWEPPEAMNGVLRYYKVFYSGNEMTVEDATHVTLHNLVAYKNYSIRVTGCTVSCGEMSPEQFVLTDIGVPGKINRIPVVRFINSSQVAVVWSRPHIPGGRLDYYQVTSGNNEIQNSSSVQSTMSIPDCSTQGRNRMHKFMVRAVNIAPDGSHLYGPWSDPGEGNCYSGGPTSTVLIVIWVIGSIGVVLSMSCTMYFTRNMWMRCRDMQKVAVNVPMGLAEENLLEKVTEHIRQSSADSSGCSSGQESVTSSLTTDSQVSADSGTEIDPVVSANKLLEPNSWENSSLRQRNVAMKPSGVETVRWDSCLKVSKGDTILDDTISLARSTPNLSDSSGFMMPQQTWSSTGYISMPSSEEMSPSPTPDKAAVGGYTVVGVLPKKAGELEVKLPKPYVSLTDLEVKPREKKPPIDHSKNLENLTKFIDPPTIPSTTPYIQAGMIDKIIEASKKASSPYVQAAMIDNIVDSSKISSTPYVQAAMIEPTKNISSPFSMPTDTMFKDIIGGSKSSNQGNFYPTSKPYVTASSVFQMLHADKGSIDAPSCFNDSLCESYADDSLSDYPLCWETEELDLSLTEDTIVPLVPEIESKGYVTVSELEQMESKNQSHQEQKTQEKKDEQQYSKVAVVPHKMP